MKKRVLIITALILLPAVLVGSGVVALGAAYGSVFNVTPYIELGGSVKDRLKRGDNYREYMFEVTENGRVSLGLDYGALITDTALGWKVYVYQAYKPDGETGEQFRELSCTTFMLSETDATTTGAIGVTPGIYKVRVTNYDSFSGVFFTLKLSFISDNAFEDEYNDSINRYTYLPLNTTISGASSTRSEGFDIDCYLFTIEKDGYAEVFFEHEDLGLPQVGWAVTLCSVGGSEFCRVTSRISADSVTTGKIGLTAGSYIVKVEPAFETTVTYSVRAVFGTDEMREREFNDTLDTATSVYPRTPVNGNLSSRFLTLDRDYYRLVLNDAGTVDISFAHETVTTETVINRDPVGWNIRVLDSEHNEITHTTSTWETLTASINGLGLDAGVYYILVDSDSAAFSSAQYTIVYSGSAEANVETEPNNTVDTADLLKNDVPFTGAIVSAGVDFDEDWYAFDAMNSTYAAISFEHSGSGIGEAWWVTVYDEELNQLARKRVLLTEQRTVVDISGLENSRYYIMVSAGLYCPDDPYTVMVHTYD